MASMAGSRSHSSFRANCPPSCRGRSRAQRLSGPEGWRSWFRTRLSIYIYYIYIPYIMNYYDIYIYMVYMVDMS